MARTFSSAGESKAKRHLEIQAAYELAAVVEEQVPLSNAPPEEWATYVNKARGKAAAAIVEWGERIAQASAAYKSQPQQWGRKWDEWCRENLGISDEYARQLVLIAENIPTTSCGVLPPSKNKLLVLAQAESTKAGVVQQAIREGRLGPDSSMQEVRSLKAEAEAQASDQVIDVQATVVPTTRSLTLPAELVERIKTQAKAQGIKPHELIERLLP